MTTFTKEMFDKAKVDGSFSAAQFEPGQQFIATITPLDLDEDELNRRNAISWYDMWELKHVISTKDPSKEYFIARFPMRIESGPNGEEANGLTGRILSYECFIDFRKGDGGMVLDTAEGRNRDLKTLRQVLGQNEEGVPWSPQDMAGQRVRLVVGIEQSADGREFPRVAKISPVNDLG